MTEKGSPRVEGDEPRGPVNIMPFVAHGDHDGFSGVLRMNSVLRSDWIIVVSRRTAITMPADQTWTFTIADLASCNDDFTPIYTIHGNGLATLIANQVVTTRGVVVGDYEGAAPALRGFSIEDPVGDDNPATSEGIFRCYEIGRPPESSFRRR